MRIMTSRATATAAAALFALTTMSLQPAAAGWRHGEEAAALTAFAVVLGTIAAIVAVSEVSAPLAWGAFVDCSDAAREGSLVFPGVQNCGNINKLGRHVCVSKC